MNDFLNLGQIGSLSAARNAQNAGMFGAQQAPIPPWGFMNNDARALAGTRGQTAQQYEDRKKAEKEHRKKYGTYKPRDPFANPNHVGLLNLSRTIWGDSE